MKNINEQYNSTFSHSYGKQAGINQLMTDLGNALEQNKKTGKKTYILGGGNPGYIPAVLDVYAARLQQISQSASTLKRMLADYAEPAGDIGFRNTFAAVLNKKYSWKLSEKNIVLTNGSQQAFFLLFNIFAGPLSPLARKKIMLPLTPEYIGYTDSPLFADTFMTQQPVVEKVSNQVFRYALADNVYHDDTIAALCVSRPSNPTGGVISDQEVALLTAHAKQQSIPLIIDNAYGLPFPNTMYVPATLTWDDHVILCMSLSKCGLPGLRTGIVVANEDVCEQLAAANSIIGLAPNSVGAVVVDALLADGSFIEMCNASIRPFYAKKRDTFFALLLAQLSGLPVQIHQADGAFFFWLVWQSATLDSEKVYQDLRRQNVIVVQGRYFFATKQNHPHTNRSIRIGYAGDEQMIADGLHIVCAYFQQQLA